jgi:predicted metalloprotease with PDZ domain
MAHSAAGFLEKQPDHHMVVLAGVEHVMYGSGIPSRVRRLTGKDYVTLINGTFDENIGDYVLLPKPLKPPFTAKLGVIVQESAGVVQVTAFSPDSLAEKAGLKEGDIIASVDGWEIQTVSDIKIALYDKGAGQRVRVKVVRKRFFLGEDELEFNFPL